MRYVLSFVSLWLLVTLVGCQKESFWEEGEGDKVALEFDLYQANVTKAAAVSVLNDKALIKVYAFKVETKTETGTKTGTGETGTPSAEGTYVVERSPPNRARPYFCIGVYITFISFPTMKRMRRNWVMEIW